MFPSLIILFASIQSSFFFFFCRTANQKKKVMKKTNREAIRYIFLFPNLLVSFFFDLDMAFWNGFDYAENLVLNFY